MNRIETVVSAVQDLFFNPLSILSGSRTLLHTIPLTSLIRTPKVVLVLPQSLKVDLPYRTVKSLYYLIGFCCG